MKKKRATKAKKKTRNKPARALRLAVQEVENLKKTLGKRTEDAKRIRWNADPKDVQRSVVKLVLTLVEFLRKLMERQAIRRMEQGTLTDEEVDRVGRALQQLEETIADLAERFDLEVDELNLELGPIGKLH